MSMILLKKDAPVAFKHAALMGQFPEEYYRPVTTLIPIDSRIDGELIIERFARDQIGRDFVVGVSGKDTAIYIHRKHWIDSDILDRETNRAIPMPTKCGVKEPKR